MKLRSIPMMHSLWTSRYAKRKSAAFSIPLLLALCLLFSTVSPSAANAEACGRADIRQRLLYEAQQPLIEQLLRQLVKGSDKAKTIVVGEWVLHSHGIAFHIPPQMSYGGNPRGVAAVLLADDEGEVEFVTNIVVSISDEDKGLETRGEEMVERRYGSQFARFELLDLSTTEIKGAVGIRIAFLTEQSPRLYMQQRLVNRDGHCFIFMLSTQNDTRIRHEGLKMFEAFCDSLIFADPASLR